MAHFYSKPQLAIVGDDNDPIIVKIPFDMKDQFKMAFPDARWNRGETAWNVPKAQADVLGRWISDQQEAFEEILAEYEALKSDLEAAEAERREAQERARMVRELEARKREAKLADGEAEFARHASVQEARVAFNQVCKGAGVPKAWARVERDEGKSSLKEMQRTLRNAGVQSKGSAV
ncbi:MAG: hypothetical protein KDK53_23070 [Maritimibacter sp.]|nr:hypothetical protein [Maritimibacter sp.]